MNVVDLQYVIIIVEDHNVKNVVVVKFVVILKLEQDVKNVESGLRFTDEAKSVLNTIDSFIDRAKELTSLRLEKGKTLSKSAQESLMQIQDRIQEVYNDLDNILGLGEEEAEQPKDSIDALWLNTQEVLARSQGVVNEGDKVE